MSAQDFVYWLQGFFELTKSEEVYPDQVKMIKDHLGYVFKYIEDLKPQPLDFTKIQGASLGSQPLVGSGAELSRTTFIC